MLEYMQRSHNGGGFEFGAARFLRVNGVLMKLSVNAYMSMKTYCAFLKFMCSTVSNWSICTIGGDLN